ncbi:MAG: hypothetical protein AAF649_12280 [Verrucomicrobiota bacterium]
MDGPDRLWWLHVVTASAVVGMSWFVQMVHYPLSRLVRTKDYALYHRQHIRRIGLLIAPLMLAEAEMASGVLLLAILAVGKTDLLLQPQWFTVSMVLLGIIWLSTFLVQLRYHQQLDRGQDLNAIGRLSSTHWLRTILWTLRLRTISG